MVGVYLLVLIVLIPFCAGDCPRNGPGASYECLPLPGYIGKQWATCLTDAYIKQKSGGHHGCADPTRTYCYYQCMLESYNREYGQVISGCTCDGEDLENKLPRECYSPDGTVCDWYSDCLEKKYPCENTDDSYAITYAQRYCQLYSKNYDWFSNQAKTWIDDVRKCLQVSLVPYIRDYSKATCDQLKQAAFDSHSPCYVNSGYCNQTCDDMLKVFWTIKSAFTEEFTESLKGLLLVADQCAQTDSGCFSNLGITRVYRFFLSHSTYKYVSCKQCLATKVLDMVAQQQKWSETALDWIAFRREAYGTYDIVFDAYITDQNLIRSSVPASNSFLVKSVNAFIDKLEKGEIEVESDGWSITKFGRCTDGDCDKPLNVTKVTTWKPKTPGKGMLMAPQLYLTAFTCLYVLVMKFM